MDDEGVVGGTALGGEYAGGGIGAEGEGGEAVDGFGGEGDGLEGVETAGGEAEGGESVLGRDAGAAVLVEGDGRGITLEHLRRGHLCRWQVNTPK